MRAALKLLVRGFVWAALAFGSGLGLFFVVPLVVGSTVTGSVPPLANWIICAALLVGGSLAFGILMTLVGSGAHIWAVRRLGFHLTDETLAVRQRRRLTLTLPFGEAFTLCAASVRQFDGIRIDEEQADDHGGVLLVRKGVSWCSCGERIRFELNERGDGGTDVFVECCPVVRSTLFDYGCALRNMDAVVSFLLAHGADLEESAVPIRPATGDVRLRTPQDGVAEERGGSGLMPGRENAHSADPSAGGTG
jgi:hypothetical protein